MTEKKTWSHQATNQLFASQNALDIGKIAGTGFAGRGGAAGSRVRGDDEVAARLPGNR